MYTPAQFLWMVNDIPRMEAYLAALKAVVRPGDRVVDVGAGFGFFSVAACRAGAAHVDAIDINPIVVGLGPRFAEANGCADRITFHHADASRLVLAEKADVLIGDLRGPLPMSNEQLRVMAAARDAFLRPGGRMISERDTLWVAPVETPASFREEIMAPPAVAAGMSLEPLQQHLRTVPYRTGVTPAELLGTGVQWAEVDYRTQTELSVRGTASCLLNRSGEMGGLAMWFDTALADGIGFSNAPGTALRAYRQMFFPLAQSVRVNAGDQLSLRIEALQTDRGHVWQWSGERVSDGRVLFKQNSLAETVMDPALLSSSLNAPVPPAGPHAASLAWLVAQMGRGATQLAVAADAHAGWPGRFASAREAELWVQRTLQELDRAERGVE